MSEKCSVQLSSECHGKQDEEIKNEKSYKELCSEIESIILDRVYKKSIGDEKLPVNPIKLANYYNVDIFEGDLELEPGVSGFMLIKKNGKAAVALSEDLSFAEKRLTLSHELGHLLYEKNHSLEKDIADIYYSDRSKEQTDKEKAMDYFARLILLPKNYFAKKYYEFKNDNVDVISKLNDFFVVPKEVISERINELGLLI